MQGIGRVIAGALGQGDTFRIRGRKFLALISCSVVDEFMPWPRDALDGVARRAFEEHCGRQAHVGMRRIRS